MQVRESDQAMRQSGYEDVSPMVKQMQVLEEKINLLMLEKTNMRQLLDDVSKIVGERLNELERWTEKFIDQYENNLCHFQQQLDDMQDRDNGFSVMITALENRAEKLEQLNQKCFDANPIKYIEDKFNSIEIQFKEIREHCMGIIGKKVPHKCRVCDGVGEFDTLETKAGMTINRNTSNEICHVCQGKGVIWGRK